MLLPSKLAGAEEFFIHPLKKSDVFTNYFCSCGGCSLIQIANLLLLLPDKCFSGYYCLDWTIYIHFIQNIKFSQINAS